MDEARMSVFEKQCADLDECFLDLCRQLKKQTERKEQLRNKLLGNFLNEILNCNEMMLECLEDDEWYVNDELYLNTVNVYECFIRMYQNEDFYLEYINWIIKTQACCIKYEIDDEISNEEFVRYYNTYYIDYVQGEKITCFEDYKGSCIAFDFKGWALQLIDADVVLKNNYLNDYLAFLSYLNERVLRILNKL